jgi:serine/threonine-protein kinase
VRLGQVSSQLPPRARLPLAPPAPGRVVHDSDVGGDTDLGATNLGATNLGAAMTAAPAGPPTTPDAGLRPRRRRWWPLAVLTVLAVLGAAAAALLTTNVLGSGPTSHAVPSLTGANQATAARLLSRAELQSRFTATASEDVAPGIVVSWAPSQGLQRQGTVVTVVLSTGPTPRVVPDLTGGSYSDAAARLQGVRLVPARQNAFSDTVAQGNVISTTPGPGTSVGRDSTVTLVVSAGPDMVSVPDVLGANAAGATRSLQDAGLKVANVFGFSSGRVFFTSPPAGSRVRRGSSVNLYTL